MVISTKSRVEGLQPGYAFTYAGQEVMIERVTIERETDRPSRVVKLFFGNDKYRWITAGVENKDGLVDLFTPSPVSP